MAFQDGETWLFWTASTDNNTPASRLVYRVIVNGVLDHALLGNTRTILYVPVGQTSRIDVVAVDEAGQRIGARHDLRDALSDRRRSCHTKAPATYAEEPLSTVDSPAAPAGY
jgi:hypothetical protein